MLDKLFKPIAGLISLAKRYVAIICIIIFGAMYAYILYTSGKLAQTEPSEAKISQIYQGTPRPKIDPSIAQKLKELEDQNVEVKTLFENARNNPFAE